MTGEFENLIHYGTPRHSGRYPWGSGKNPYQSNRNFVGYIQGLRAEGMSEKEIAQGLGWSIRDLRSEYSYARNAMRQQDVLMVQKLRDKGMSTQAIAERMGIPESTVRSHLKPGVLDKALRIDNTKSVLESELQKHKYIDIGVGVEHHLGVSRETLNSAVKGLTDEGWQVHYLGVPQVTMPGQKTSTKVLAPPGTKTTDIYHEFDQVGTIGARLENNGRTKLGIAEPKSIDSKRVQVVYANEGGAEADGLIYVRPGVEDLSLGGNNYAQVRIAVDGTHYIKGMAVYKEGLPKGVDLQFNTNKDSTGNKLDALKPMQMVDGKIDKDNPFGSAIKRQITKKDANGNDVATSVMNIVNEEGDWDDWNKSLPSQMLSKQSKELAKKQLDEVVRKHTDELEAIKKLTNPTVKKHLLLKHAEAVDSDAVDLQAAALPRQATSVIIPVKSLKDNQIYAPRFNNGEEVVLVRFPHGGVFEIPTLKVNNRNPEARAMIPPGSVDAVGINARVAAQLSGADFDGDTVLVIPNEKTGTSKIRTSKPLEQLKGFDPGRAYPGYEGMPKLTDTYKQKLMGDVSNLITDMTIKGATEDELARAVKHSMVVIDAVKHNLNWRQSKVDNQITELKKKYQGGPTAGASTIISRSTAETRIDDRKLRRASKGGPIDPRTGELVYEPTGKTRTVRSKTDPSVLEEVPIQIKTTRGAVTRDAHELVSDSGGTAIERVYADHANKLKLIANNARKEYLAVKEPPRSPSAAKTYATEVAQLRADLTQALSNAPLERRAQLIANTVVAAKKADRPDASKDTIKKWNNQAIAEARARLQAKKIQVPISDRQWEAIQAGAVSKTMLEQILMHADIDRIRELATPRSQTGITPAMLSRARAMVNGGATLAEVAQALGISASGLSSALRG